MSEPLNDEFDKDYWFEMYQSQCEATDEWAKKYRDEVERKADATLLARCEELQRVAEVANAMVGKERDQTMRQAKRIAELETQINLCVEANAAYSLRNKALEASLADSNEALQVMGLKLAHAEGSIDAIGRLASHNIPPYAFGDNEAACDMAGRLSDIQGLSHSANTVGGPTPVMDAAPAWQWLESSVEPSLSGAAMMVNRAGESDR